tara:strand:+ start:52329 stop:55505 length:3177 start_codon:yes stop_codon:yes gene_type:complete
MLSGFLVLLGVLGLARLNVSLFPEMDVPQIYLLTEFPGQGPNEVEQMVTIPLEEAVSGCSGLKELESRSERGLSVIKVTFEWGRKPELAMVELRQILDRVYSSLPENASRTTMLAYDPTREPIMLLHVQDRGLGRRLRFFAETSLRPELEQLAGVAAVDIDGGRKREIRIAVDKSKAYALGLDIRTLAQSIRSHNVERSVGFVHAGAIEKTVRLDSRARSLEEIGSIPVKKGKENSIVPLSAVARVRDGYSDPTGEVLLNGKTAVILKIRKEASANTLHTVRAVREALKRINTRHRESVRISILENKSEEIRDSIDSVTTAAALGGAIAFVLLLIFLNSIRSASLIGLTMPISILISFGFLYLFAVDLNIMSLGGMALGVGMLIDGSIMVSESINRELQRNQIPEPDFATQTRGNTEARPDLTGAEPITIFRDNKRDLSARVARATGSITGSLTASTLTTVVVFLPITLVSGIAAAMFKDLAIAVIVTLLCGLYCSLVLMPVCAVLLELRATESRNGSSKPMQGRWRAALHTLSRRAAGFMERLEDRYLACMRSTLARPRRTILLFLAMSGSGLLLLLLLPYSLMSDSVSGSVEVEFALPPGSDYERTTEFARSLESELKALPEIRSTLTRIGHESDDPSEKVQGRMPENQGAMTVYLKPGIRGAALLPGIRSLDPRGENIILQAAPAPGAIHRILGQGRRGFNLDMRGLSNQQAKILMPRVARQLRKSPHVSSVGFRNQGNQPLLKLAVRDRLIPSPSPALIATHLKSSIKGVVVSRFREGDRSIDMRLRLDEGSTRRVEDLDQIKLNLGSDKQLSLQGLLKAESVSSVPALLRKNQSGLHRLSFSISRDKQDAALPEIRKNIEAALVSQPGETGRSRASYSIRPAARASEELQPLFFAFLLSGILIYQLLAAQFESYLQPLALLISIPGMLPGCALSLFLFDHGLNIGSATGMVLLTGIVINSSIALFEETEMRRTKTTDVKTALMQAGRTRLRPILLTTMTTAGGMLPLAFLPGTGGSLQEPMAIAILGGLITGTASAIVIYPCFYYLIESRRTR